MASTGNETRQASYDEPPPPYGWTKQFDQKTNHPFWVDTTTNPPRSIWVHPYDDPQFLSDHPDIRDQLAQARDEGLFHPPPGPPPDTAAATASGADTKRHSHEDASRLAPRPADEKGGSRSHPGTPAPNAAQQQDAAHRGFFGKLKDKAIGTKEERAEAKRQEEEYERQREQRRQDLIRQIMEQSRQQQTQRGGAISNQGPYGRQGMGNTRVVYASPMGDPYANGYGGGYYGGRRGLGMGGGMGMPLLGGLAGGMLLGDMMGGGFGGGGFGGGGFGGGFDGGGFGGGGGGW